MSGRAYVREGSCPEGLMSERAFGPQSFVRVFNHVININKIVGTFLYNVIICYRLVYIVMFMYSSESIKLLSQ